jgi:hypothetical protein
MHRNTYLLVTFLAIFAALLVGVNLGRKIAPSKESSAVSITATPSPIAAPPVTRSTYKNTFCGFSFQFPDTLTKLEDASGSALFVETSTTKQILAVACQKDIPRPPLVPEKIETLSFSSSPGAASISAKLYHDASAKDGTPVDALIFRNPKTGLDVYIAGFGDTYNEVLSTLTLTP